MNRCEVKVTEEMRQIFESFALTDRGAVVVPGDILKCGEEGAWYISGMFVFAADKPGNYNYWDDKFTDWLKKNYPELWI